MKNAMAYAEPGMTAPADGNSAGEARGYGVAEMGANFELLEELRPELVNALRELVRQYRQEGRRRE